MKRTAGFTMIELLVYIGLLSMLLAVMSQVFLATVSLKVESEAANGIQQDGRYSVARLTRDIRRASSIQSPVLGGTSGSLVLTVNENGTDVSYTYATAGGALVLTVDGETVSLTGDQTQVREFDITRVGNSGTDTAAKDTLRIRLGLEDTAQVGSTVRVFNAVTTVGLR